MQACGHRLDPDDVSAQIDLIGMCWLMSGFELQPRRSPALRAVIASSPRRLQARIATLARMGPDRMFMHRQRRREHPVLPLTVKRDCTSLTSVPSSVRLAHGRGEVRSIPGGRKRQNGICPKRPGADQALSDGGVIEMQGGPVSLPMSPFAAPSGSWRLVRSARGSGCG